MKKILFFLAAAAALVACTPKQTAKVEKFLCPHSGMLKGVVVTYDVQIDEASIEEGTYVVEGPEVAGVKVDSNRVALIFKAPGKHHHECGEAEGCEHEKEACDKAEGCDKKDKDCCEKKEACDKAEGCDKKDKDCCEKKEGCEKHEGCDEKKDCCEKKEGCEKHEGCEEKAEGCEHHEGCDKPEGKDAPKDCCEAPEITVKQAKDIKTVDGKIVKAWKKAVKAL